MRRDEINAIAARNGAANVRVSGSVARNDVNFLVAMTEHLGPWFPARLELDLEDALQIPVMG